MAVFPQESVAVYVLFRIRLQPFAMVTSFDVITGVPQLSVTTGVPGAGITGLQPNVAPAGHEVMTGAIVSCMVNSWKQVELFPHASVTVKFLRIVPPQPFPIRDSVEHANVSGSEASLAIPPSVRKAFSVAGQGGKSARH